MTTESHGTEAPTARARRTQHYLRWGFAAVLVFSVAQVAWWMLDQWIYVQAVEDQMVDLLDPQGLDEFRAEGRRRLNRYAWEGGFFFVVLIAAVGVIGKALRDDAVLRRRQQNFMAAVSHELKSPLAAARVAAENLQMHDPPLEQRRIHVARLLRSVDRLDAMISNLLDTVRIEEGQLVADIEDAQIVSALEPVLRVFRERARDQGVALETEIDTDLYARIDVLAGRLVLRNLLENAFSAVLGVDAPRIVVRGARLPGLAGFEVVDNGCGFEPAEAVRLFDKFYRPGDEMRRGGRGAGLGLYLVAEIVARTGGQVRANSEGPGRGAQFRVFWPAVETLS